MAKIQCSLPWHAHYNNHWRWVTDISGKLFHTELFGVNKNHETPFCYRV